MKAALYTRVSTREQVDGLSLDNQRTRLMGWAEREGWEVVADYQDAGYSGRNTNRPAFQQMLADAERRQFDLILARVRERMFRNSLDARIYADRLRGFGVQIRYLDEPELEDTPVGFLMDSQLSAYAEYFSRDLAHKTKLGKQARLRNGQSNGRPPFGYESDWTISETNGPIVQELFARYASGAWSHAQLSGWLSTLTGQRFGTTRVLRTLRNPIYIGKLHNGERGVHPALVDEAQWYRAAEVAKERESKPVAYRQREHAFVLSGLGRDIACGMPIWGQTKASGARRYRCSDRERGGSCQVGSVKADILEDALTDIIMQVHLPPDWQDAIRDGVMAEPATDEGAERKRLGNRLARTRRALVDGLIEYEEGRRVIRETEAALARLAVPRLYEAAGEVLTDLPALWSGMNLLGRRNAAQSILEAVDVDLEAGEIVSLKPKAVYRPLFEVAGYVSLS